MRFGLVLPTSGPRATPEGVMQCARLGEIHGFETVWATDHIMVGRDAASYQSIFEAITVLAFVTAATSTVKVGTSVLVLPQRHAVLAAKQLACLDVLSKGRLTVGVGAGYVEREFQMLGSDFRRRGAVLDEQIALLRYLWSADRTPFEGSVLQLDGDQSFAPLPAQPGGPPIWIGGASDRALLRAARLGDGWHASRLPPDAFRARAQALDALGAERRLTLSVRLDLAAERGISPGRQGPALTLGGSTEQVLEDLHNYANAGCHHVAINCWDGDPAASEDRLLSFIEGAKRRFEGSTTHV